LNWRHGLLAFLALASMLVAGTAQAQFTDNFDRADNAAIGNGWIEKTPAAFAITNNSATKLTVGTGYRDNIVYRPAAENVADVEASVEVRFNPGAPGYAQILTRVQTGTVATTGVLDGYILYIADSTTTAILGRQTGANFVTTLGTLNLSNPLNTTDTYRLRLSTVGTSPVVVTAWVERLVASSWQVIGTATANDAAPERITAAGSVGFSGFVEAAYRFDNFSRTNIVAGSNPVPVTGSLAPNSATQGESGLTVTVSGSNFVSTSVVRWNGANRTTTFVNANTLEAAILSTDLAASGTANITVFNPAPGGGTSNAQTFTIAPNTQPNPVPTLTSVSPTSRAQGSGAFTLTVNGTNFASTAVVRWNGANRATTFVSPTQLTANIPATDITTAGTAAVTVFNPAPGGGTSNSTNFTITATNPAPIATTLTPSSATAGGAAFTLTVNGSSFINGSVIRWNGANRTTTFDSSTQLRATISATDIATAGTATVTVLTPTPGGGTSAGLTFTINASGGGGGGGHSMTNLAPISQLAGSSATLVTITGSGFTTGSVARWNGSNRTTTFVSSTTIRVTLNSSDLLSESLGAITVSTPGASPSVTAPLPFFVQAANTQLFADYFNRTDSATIGNGWTEKNPAAFALAGGQITSVDTTPLDYHDNIVYRTATGEDQLNVETAIEFRRVNTTSRFPQLHARVQRNTIAQADTLGSYILYFEDNLPSPGALAIAVQPALTNQPECIMTTIPLPQALDLVSRYRLRFRVTGAFPVQLTGIIERFDGSAWQVMAQGTMNHDNNTPRNADPYCPYTSVPAAITTAGTVGFAKYFQPADVYDNFHWRSIGPAAPNNTPTLNTISPTSATAGAPAFTLTVTGANFNTNSVVRWNGANRTTTFVSSTQLTAAITAADVASTGTATIQVFTSGTGGGLSPQTASFSITPPSGSSSFSDNFTRANSDVLGNGWIEKTPAAWFLTNGTAAKQAVSTSYPDNLVYRPASENALNTDVSAVFRLTNASPGYLQIVSRVQTDTAAVANFLDAYMLYVDGVTNRAILGRQRGYAFVTTLATLNIAPTLNTTDTYRLRLITTGTTSVQLSAFVERLGTSGWEVIGQATATDTSAERIATAGSVGFGGYVEAAYTFDDFSRSNLP
jgi:hypothetical protein